MVGILVSFWDGLFSGAVLVLGSVVLVGGCQLHYFSQLLVSRFFVGYDQKLVDEVYLSFMGIFFFNQSLKWRMARRLILIFQGPIFHFHNSG